MRFPPFPTTLRGQILCLLALSLLGLTGCHSDRVSVNPKDPHSPQYSYRLDELALLHMAADDVQDMERKKQYGEIYDQYGSNDFKSAITRRRFLIMTNCVENYLGGLDEYDTNDLGFRRETVKGHPKLTLDVLNRKVQRIQGSIEEQMVFVPSGLNFKLNSLYWVTKDKAFNQCIADSANVEAATQPEPTGAETATTQTPTTQTPEQQATAPTATEQAKTPENAQPASPQATAQPSAPGTAPVPGNAAPTPPPVQPMKPAEIHKAPLEARPAGAGAVIDERPAPKKAKTPKADTTPGDTDTEKSKTPSAGEAPVPVPAEQEPAMPLPVPPDKEPAHH